MVFTGMMLSLALGHVSMLRVLASNRKIETVTGKKHDEAARAAPGFEPGQGEFVPRGAAGPRPGRSLRGAPALEGAGPAEP